jgi:hypothetical protein
MTQPLVTGLKPLPIILIRKFLELEDQDAEKILIPPGAFNLQVEKIKKDLLV